MIKAVSSLRMNFLIYGTYTFLFFLLFSCGKLSIPAEVAEVYRQLEVEPDYNLDIRPILSDKCFPCHGPDQGKLKAGLRLDLEHLAKGILPDHPDKRAIVSGSVPKSELVVRILSEDAEVTMPPVDSKLTLTKEEKAMLIKWIEEGATYKDHWAFIPPRKVPVPDDQHPVDYWIDKGLAKRDLHSNNLADRETLLRRLTFDLTGLPPTLEQIEQFIANEQPGSYERLVDQLLASPHFGERMATDWMDVARYADTHGYTVDRYRDVSPWRDWVIQSFNENMPYDQFITWQLAGDLLPEGRREQKIATAFLRLHPQNMEGGIVPEEFRVEYVADRTNTLGTALMGMTLSCAKCHDHKFDPITQKEYYQLFSFFNNLNEAGQISFNDAMPVPTILLTDRRQDSIMAFINAKLDSLKNEALKANQQLTSEADKWIDSQAYKMKDLEKPRGQIGNYPLDGHLNNTKDLRINGKMDQNNTSGEKPNFVKSVQDQGILLNGDAWLDLGGIGSFDRYQPFSVGLMIQIPKDLTSGVIFHTGNGAVLYNFRGYHLALKDNRLELLMAHTAPDNAIIRYVDSPLPREQWIHLLMAYDGSGKADGLNVFLNGDQLDAVTEVDNLYKSLFFNFSRQKEPGLQVGARWRGKGIKGAIVDQVTVFDRCLTNLEIKIIADPSLIKDLVQKKAADLSRSQRDLLNRYYIGTQPRALRIEEELRITRREYCSLVDTIQELMVFKEMPRPRPTHLLDRGQYDVYKEEVTPSTPRAILTFDTSIIQPTRLDLARWLTDPRHPLTARVFVNRIWQQFFGRGLVRTSEDFGNQGTAPSHPELLDHLAVHFQEIGWDIKALIRFIVTSGAYQRSSITTLENRQRDPENLYLSRGPSKRLSAEMIRDQALAASGLLHRKIGGKSVSPYQPEGLWRINGANYVQSQGHDLYRRSLYTIWKRSVPHPTQGSFDAPERSECITRRQQTNTPLQALVLMNDPIFVETAIELGRQMQQSGELISTYRKLTGRKPVKVELDVLMAIWHEQLRHFRIDPSRAKGWLNNVAKDDMDLEAAAYAVVASTIINSDAFIVNR